MIQFFVLKMIASLAMNGEKKENEQMKIVASRHSVCQQHMDLFVASTCQEGPSFNLGFLVTDMTTNVTSTSQSVCSLFMKNHSFYYT